MQKAEEDLFQKGWSALFNPAQQPRKMRAGLYPFLVGDVNSYSGGAENRGQTWVGDLRDVRVRWRRRRFSSQKGGQGICGGAINAGVGDLCDRGPSVRKRVRRTQKEAGVNYRAQRGSWLRRRQEMGPAPGGGGLGWARPSYLGMLAGPGRPHLDCGSVQRQRSTVASPCSAKAFS